MFIDASVALKWYLAEADSGAAEALFAEQQLAAPELIVAEVGNALWKAWRRGVLTAEKTQTALTNLADRLTALHPLQPLAARAGQISRELDHPVYDCFYLACAERDKDSLVTADARLLRVVAGSSWESLCHPLQSGA